MKIKKITANGNELEKIDYSSGISTIEFEDGTSISGNLGIQLNGYTYVPEPIRENENIESLFERQCSVVYKNEWCMLVESDNYLQYSDEQEVFYYNNTKINQTAIIDRIKEVETEYLHGNEY